MKGAHRAGSGSHMFDSPDGMTSCFDQLRCKADQSVVKGDPRQPCISRVWESAVWEASRLTVKVG
jgi:hypothetical protein